MSKWLMTSLIWVLTIGVVFALLWWKGYLVQLRNYWDQTWDELYKCSWPSWAELKGSTVVVAISILILGVFTVAVDLLFSSIFLLFNI